MAKNINIGDKLWKNNKVYGIVNHDCNHMKFYKGIGDKQRQYYKWKSNYI